MERHFPHYATEPTKLDLVILRGIPSCLCPLTRPSIEDGMQYTVRCALRHLRTKCTRPLAPIRPQSPVLVQSWSRCNSTHRCDQYGTEWEVTVRNWQDLASHAYLTVERIIDAGPVEWVLRHDQLSEQSYPVYRYRSCGNAVLDRQLRASGLILSFSRSGM